jgi:ABC-type spermidine/putrescine transport system permease subunit I
MNDKLNIPEEIMGLRCSWRNSCKAGGAWMMLAYLTDVPGAYLIAHHKDWPLVLRIIVALLPLLASLLYVRGIVRWIRGMDELHRQLTLAAFGFAAVAYLFLGAAWSLLMDRAGVFESVFHLTRLQTLERMPFFNCTLIIAMTYILFGIGYTHIFNRRYK